LPIKEFLFFLVPILLISFLGEKLLRKKFNIEKVGWLYRPVNSLQKRSELILLIGFIFTYAAFSFSNLKFTNYLIFAFFVLLNALRAYMEWKYDRTSKQFILSIWGCGIFVIIFVGLLFI
jgi:hypothetical protein